ncbi:MAG: hypothetical protein R3D51_17025 [Hyphomicrobiaceae bacterium]
MINAYRCLSLQIPVEAAVEMMMTMILAQSNKSEISVFADCSQTERTRRKLSDLGAGIAPTLDTGRAVPARRFHLLLHGEYMTKTIIARRTLHVGATPVEISVECPVLDGEDYCCRYAINWPQCTQKGYAMGVDSMQALILALSHIASDVRSPRVQPEEEIYWLELGDEGGFARS